MSVGGVFLHRQERLMPRLKSPANDVTVPAKERTMIRVIALDMDDTLLKSDGSISGHTLALLERWRQAGNHIVVATGRPPRAIGESLPPQLHDVPWICYNGAEIRLHGETIYENLIPTSDVRHVVDWGQRLLPTWRVGIEIDDTLFMNQRLTIRKEYTFTPDLMTVATQPAAKVLFTDAGWQTIDEPHESGDPFAPLGPLLASLPPDTRPILSRRYKLAQLLSSTADKAVALRYLVEGWGKSMANVVAFGDDVNDVDMLAASGMGVAVANAVPEVLAVADRVTGSNDEDGIAAILSEMVR